MFQDMTTAKIKIDQKAQVIRLSLNLTTTNENSVAGPLLSRNFTTVQTLILKQAR